MIQSFVELEKKLVDGETKTFVFVRNYSDGALSSEYDITNRPLGVDRGTKYYDLTRDGKGKSTKETVHLAEGAPSRMWCSLNCFEGGNTSYEIKPKNSGSTQSKSSTPRTTKEDSLKISSALKKVELIEKYKKIHSMDSEAYADEILEGSTWKEYLTTEMWEEIKANYLEAIRTHLIESKKDIEDKLFEEILNS